MLKNICTDLETSKKLKELGLNLETQLYHTKIDNDKYFICSYHSEFVKDMKLCPGDVYIPAYTLEQILNKLPKSLNSGAFRYNLSVDYIEECIEYKWISDEPYTEDKILIWGLRDITDNFATTAAKLWIQLKNYEII